jgi:tagatose 6-phosphate kinase
MILCIGTTPAAQRVMMFRRLAVDAVNRAAVTLDGAAGKSVNVAKVLAALGAPVAATGFLGGDRGEFIRQALVAAGVAADFVTVPARTRQCITVIDEATGTHTELVEESSAVTAADFEQLLGIIRHRCAAAKLMVLSGSIAPGGPADFYRQCAELARAAGSLAIVDAQGAALRAALPAQPGLIKPNRVELAATVGRELPGDAEVRAAMRELHEQGAQQVVVTAGPNPVVAFDGKHFWNVPPPKVQAANPIGSGDAFTAGLAWRLAAGDDLGEACRWGVAAGAANALTLMPGELNRADVERLAAGIQPQRV